MARPERVEPGAHFSLRVILSHAGGEPRAGNNHAERWAKEIACRQARLSFPAAKNGTRTSGAKTAAGEIGGSLRLCSKPPTRRRARRIPSRSTASVFDGSRYQYGEVLKGLWVDISAGEFRDGRRRSLIARRLHHVDHDPRTLRSRLKDAVRDHDQCVERSRWEGRLPVPYLATVKIFIGPEGKDQPFAEKTVHGEIARSWI
jgi:hypothetical protein